MDAIAEKERALQEIEEEERRIRAKEESVKKQREHLLGRSGTKRSDEFWQRRWVLGRQLNAKGQIAKSPGLKSVVEETERLNRMPHSFEELDRKVLNAVGAQPEYMAPDNKGKDKVV